MAGIIVPILFTALVVVQSALQPDYRQITQPISALAAWPYGWVQNVGFVVCGSLMIAFAVALHRGVPRRRRGWIAFVLLLTSALGIVLDGVFPWRRVGTELAEPPGHAAGSVMAFAGAGLGLIALSRRMAPDPKWRRLGRYVLASGVAVMVLFLVLGGLAIEKEMPLHPWVGLIQRMLLAIWFPCLIVMAWRLLRTTDRPAPP